MSEDKKKGKEEKKEKTEENYLKKACELHSKYVLIDGHNDIAWKIRADFEKKLSKFNFEEKHEAHIAHTDIPRFIEGGLGAQFFSVYIPSSLKDGNAVKATLEQIDIVHRIVEKYPNTFEFALTSEDIYNNFKNKKISALIGMEGGHSIGASLAVLRMFYKLGCRYMTLTHNGHNEWADSAVDMKPIVNNVTKEVEFAKPLHNGLSLFGRQVVFEMNRLGMLIDLSHVSDNVMNDALQFSVAPVIFSHSSCRAVCHHPRNVPDNILLKLKQNNGIIMITFVSAFVKKKTNNEQ